jgi:cytoskeleton protein RodZ
VLEEPEQIGAKLKAAREAQGLTLEDVIFRTQLPRSAVMALENEDFSAFTSPVYAKSFLAQYSGFLNVDAHPWLEALQPGGFTPDGLLQPLVDAPDEDAVEKNKRSRPQTQSQGQGGWLAVLGLLALTGVLVFAVVKGYEFFETRFGAESKGHAPVGGPVARDPAAMRPPGDAAAESEAATDGRSDSQPAVAAEDDEVGKPPPRAIIVR